MTKTGFLGPVFDFKHWLCGVGLCLDSRPGVVFQGGLGV